MKRKQDTIPESSVAKKSSRDLVSLQIDDWLSEDRLNSDEIVKLENLTQQVKQVLLTSRRAKRNYELSDLSWLSSNNIVFPLDLPFGLNLSDVKSSNRFSWIPPSQVEALSIGHMFMPGKSSPATHLDVTIPEEVFGSRDFLNFSYHVKRALYLCWAALLLKKADFYVQFAYEEFDHLRPILIVATNREDLDKYAVYVHFSPHRGFAKPSRFRSENNNLRYSFCSKTSKEAGESPTPYYNSSILADIVRAETTSCFAEFFKDLDNIRSAILLVRQWLRKKNFSAREDGFDDFLLNAWFVRLCTTDAISDQNSVVEIIEVFLGSLGILTTLGKGLSLSDVDESRFEQYKRSFEFVFLDYSGYLNLARSLSSFLVERLCVSAADSLRKLRIFSQFDSLFLVEHSFSSSFDVYVRCRLTQKYLADDFAPRYSAECTDSCGNYCVIFKRKACPLLKKAWSSRIHVFDIFVQNPLIPQWDGTSKPCALNDDGVEIIFGAQVLPGYDSSLVRGPQAKSSEARDFRSFWGEICELRKFADNAICETVVWDKNATSPQTLFKICRHILSRHLKVSPSCFVGRSFFDEDICAGDVSRFDVISKAYDKLSQTLRLVQDLPLLITNVQPVSPFLRRTSPLTPCSSDETVQESFTKVLDSVAFPSSRCSPPYLPSVEVHLSMEQSGKWGEDLGAIAHLKAAFYIALTKTLKEKGIMAFPFARHLLVLMDTVVFKLVISYPREIQIMKRSTGGILKDSAESRVAEREIVMRPRLAAYLYSTSHQHPAFSETCRLAIYWLSSQMLADYIDAIIVETIVAFVFVNPLFAAAPRTHYMGFLHFLLLLSTHNWLMKPLFVDFTGEWEDFDIEEMEKDFVKLRPVLPAMVVCTPADRSGTRWTREEPQPLILNRIISLASSTASLLQQHVLQPSPLLLESLFEPNLAIFDLVIYLRDRHIARRKRISGATVKDHLPVCDYDPVEKYVQQLRDSFDPVLLLFYDNHGANNKIGVIWRKNVLEARTASVTSSLHRVERKADGMLLLNTLAIQEDFALLGRELVYKIVTNN